MISNNPPVVIELEPELADFLVENCESNIEFALRALQTMGVESRAAAEKLVEMNDKFKRLRDAVRKARE